MEGQRESHSAGPTHTYSLRIIQISTNLLSFYCPFRIPFWDVVSHSAAAPISFLCSLIHSCTYSLATNWVPFDVAGTKRTNKMPCGWDTGVQLWERSTFYNVNMALIGTCCVVCHVNGISLRTRFWIDDWTHLSFNCKSATPMHVCKHTHTLYIFLFPKTGILPNTDREGHPPLKWIKNT